VVESALVITGAGGVTVNVKAALPVPVALVAPSVTVKVPATVGVPVMAPEETFTLNPAGNPVALKLVGVLLAAIV